ncbi:MAG: KH domain-containing protein [Oscillospiraceae bacterium]|jgi:predicted RNA-binding protein YlqC (UPF0109 family)|nr:KH domain-containing protein [Oscillospiraceae bacterium]
MKDLLVYITQNLVEKTDDISVAERETEAGIVYELSVASDDMGKVIGRHGRIAKDIRTLMRAAGKLRDMRVSVDIIG